MFFYLSKILSYILNPLAWVVILLFLTVFVRKPGKKKRYLFVSLITLLFFTNPFIGDEAIRAWEKPLNKVNGNHYTVGILLGGDIVSYDKESDRLIFCSGADRLLQAISLYKSGKIEKILISGGSGHLLYKDRTEASFVKRYLTEAGFNPDDIIVENMSKNTFENALYTAKILQKNDITDTALLITSSMHMRRASACFRKQGITIEEYTTSKITGRRITNFDHLLIPSITTLKNWNILIHELLGFGIYKLMGYC